MAYTDGPKSPAGSNAGSGVVVLLKQKMQSLRDDVDKYKDLYEEKCEEVDSERARRNEVRAFMLSYFM